MHDWRHDDVTMARHRQLLLDLAPGGAKSLQSFVPGPNAEALAAVRRAAVASDFEVVWIHGPKASGKTHLLQGACRVAAARDRPVAYLPGALLEPGSEDRAAEALAGLDDCALVAVDDVECWLEVTGGGEALLGVYQAALRGPPGVLLISSRGRPPEVSIPLQDLASRLRAAAAYRLCELDDGDKAEVLHNRAQERGLQVRPEVIRYLLRHGPRDTPALLEGFTRLEQAAALDQRQVTIPLLKQVLGL